MLSFLHSPFLFALAGLALPVLIHRISRARARAWPFPSISLIRKVPLPRQGRRKISDWWLLLLRMLLLALLILGLAGPQWTPPAGATSPGEAGRSVIVLDLSSSMHGWNALPQAREQIRELMEALPANELVGMVTFDAEILKTIAPEPGSRDRSLSTLQQAAARTVNGNPAPALRTAMEFLARAPAGSPRRLILVSDFQATNWAAGELPLVPASVDLRLLPVGQPRAAPNVAVLESRTVPQAGGETIKVLARVRNFGNRPVETEVGLRTSGRSASQSVELPAASGRTVRFTIPIPQSDAEGRITVSTKDDPYAPDDQYFFWAAEPPAVTVLSVVPANAPQQDYEEAFFLDQAVQAISEHEWLGFSLTPARPDALTPATLQRAAAVFLPAGQTANPDIPWPQLATWMEEDGGTVLATMASGAARGLRAMEKAGLPAPPYLGRSGMERDRRSAPSVGGLPAESPLAAVFSGDAVRDLYLLQLRRVVRLEKPPQARVFLQTESGDPLLLAIPHGKGRLLLSTFAWHRQSTDLPLRAAFLPLVRELLAGAVPANGGIRSINTFDPLPGEGDTPASDPGVRYFAGTPIEINVSRAESDPATVPQGELRRLLRGGAGTEAQSTARTAASASAFDAGGAIPLGRWLLLAALLLWILETVLATRLSRTD